MLRHQARILCRQYRTAGTSPIKLHFIKHLPAEPPGTNPVLILHGLFGSCRNWTTVSRNLASRLNQTIYAVDLRNHGKSVGAEREMSWEALVGDIECLLESESLSGATLIGHSLGGQVAMQALLSGNAKVNRRVDRLVVVDVSPKRLEFAGMAILLKALLEIEQKGYSDRRDAERHLSSHNPTIVQFLLCNLERRLDGKWGFSIPLEAIHSGMFKLSHDFDKNISAKVSKPTLFIRGELSDYIGPDDEKLIHRLFSNVRIVTVPGAGHWVHYEAPEAFVEKVVEFIK